MLAICRVKNVFPDNECHLYSKGTSTKSLELFKHTTLKRRVIEKPVTKQNPLAYAAECGFDCPCSGCGIL